VTASKPIIFLDVDGVLNRLQRPAPDPDHFTFEPVFCAPGGGPCSAFPLELSKEMGAALLDITDDIRWATSWTHWYDHANLHIGPRVGFPHLPAPMCENGRMSEGPTSAKFRVVQDELRRPGPPVIWIDDDVADPMQVDDPHFRLLCVNPEPGSGLTRSDIARIKQFLAEKAAA
jgi:hypothetical protein